jgi:hypothetical protein
MKSRRSDWIGDFLFLILASVLPIFTDTMPEDERKEFRDFPVNSLLEGEIP